jgi:molecular chaperone DnaK
VVLSSGSVTTGASVYFGNDATYFGQDADTLAVGNPGPYASFWKRDLGTDTEVAMGPGGVPLKARDCARVTFVRLKEQIEKATGHMVNEVILTCPASFAQRPREELVGAAGEAGLKVLSLVSEPVAAGLGIGVHQRGDRLVLMIDVGAGTTDIAVLQVRNGDVSVIAIGGVAKLGGCDMDAAILRMAREEFRKQHGSVPDLDADPAVGLTLVQQVERAKIVTCRTGRGMVLVVYDGKTTKVELTTERLERTCATVVDQIAQCAKSVLRDAGKQVSDIQEVNLVGGAAQFPSIRRSVEQALGVSVTVPGDPLYAVVKGGVIAGRMEMERLCRPVVVDGRRLPALRQQLTERSSLDIGVTTVTPDRDREINSVIIPRNSLIPGTYAEVFQLAEPGQTTALIELLQGSAGADRKECRPFGEFEMADLPAIHDRPHGIRIEVVIDRNGMLTARACDQIGGAEFSAQVPWRLPNVA